MILFLFFSDDIWMSIFRTLAKKKDISTVFPLRQVSKRWDNALRGSLIEATILREESVQG